MFLGALKGSAVVEEPEHIAALNAHQVTDLLLSLTRDVATIAERSATKADLAAVERNIATLSSDVMVIKSNYVTGEHLHKELQRQTVRLMAFVGGLNIAMFSAALYALNHWK